MVTRRTLAWALLSVGLAVWTPATHAQCVAPATWFQSGGTPEPDFHQPGSNCEFHQWAWQEFLWLTQPTGPGRIRLLDMPTEDSLFSPGQAPHPLRSGMMQNRLKKQSLRLAPRTMKSQGATSIGDIRQAGTSGVLVDKRGRPVYYASFVSPEYYEFVRTKQLYLKPNYIAAPDDMNFPTKAVELKSAWMVVPDGTPSDGFFTTTAAVPKLKCTADGPNCAGSSVVVDMTQLETVTVALVGLHVVGVLEGHPEFVWSTFEHVDNAPDLPANVLPTDPTAVSNVDKTFYAKGTFANQCNVRNSGSVALDETAQALSPTTNVFRQFPSGGGSAEDTANIQSLNASVHSQLDTSSVWKNYELAGGVWFADGSQLVPGLNFKTIQPFVFGSVHLSNTTMETFSQAPIPNSSGSPIPSNCFSCHTTQMSGGLPAKNMNISHILVQGLVERDQFEQLARMNLTRKHVSDLADQGVEFSDLIAMSRGKLLASPPAGAPLASYADVQKCLNDFVSNGSIPIQFAPHADFWNSMTYQQFTTGDIPGVSDPITQKPLKVLVVKDGDHSNIVMALRGTPGTIFDPNKSGMIGRMPPGGPFMPDNDIQRIVNWINAGAPQ